MFAELMKRGELRKVNELKKSPNLGSKCDRCVSKALFSRHSSLFLNGYNVHFYGLILQLTPSSLLSVK